MINGGRVVFLDGGERKGTGARPVGDVTVLRPTAVVNGWKFGMELMQRWECGSCASLGTEGMYLDLS